MKSGVGEMGVVGAGMVAVFLGYTLIIGWVNDKVPDPYMDEVFHVHQTQLYCQGLWSEWNPKITTPPGLYYAALAMLSPVSGLAGDTHGTLLCSSTPILRSLNAFHAATLFLLLYLILRAQAQDTSVGTAAWVALNTVSFPVLWFSSLLYYTDLLSLNAVAAMYLLTQLQLSIFAAIFGAASLFMRQSNVVWVLFCAGVTAHLVILNFCTLHGRPKFGKRTRSPRGPTIAETLSELFFIMERRPILAAEFASRVFSRLSGFVCVLIGFGVFVISNGGLALGDKSAHQVVFHLAQLYYFFGFCAAFGLPALLSRTMVGDSWAALKERPKLWLALGVSMVVGVATFSYDHPYLLADNRHYTFYLWKNWFRAHSLCRFLLVPGYLLALGLISRGLEGQGEVWRLGFFAATALATIPNRLLEFRYFIVPFVLWRLHTRHGGARLSLALELLAFSLLNLATLALFFYRPFRWASEPHNWQRFMW